MPPFQSYVICTSPRSGSTLLCRLLAATGVAGRPASLFHEPSLDDWRERFGLASDAERDERQALAQIFASALERGRGGTGIFGLRLQRHSFGFFREKLAILHPDRHGDLARLEAAFGSTLFIHLTRLDKAAQAVSYVKAQQSGLWHRASDGTELERLSPPREPVYDAALLRSTHDTMTTADREWEAWFAEQGIAPMHLTYETLSADPSAALRRVLEALGLDPAPAANAVPDVARLADATSRDWTERLRSELGLA